MARDGILDLAQKVRRQAGVHELRIGGLARERRVAQGPIQRVRGHQAVAGAAGVMVVAGPGVVLRLGRQAVAQALAARPALRDAVVELVGPLGAGKTSFLRAVAGALEGITPLSATWRQLVGFAADYYQRSLGEVALAALPPQLRDLTPKQMERRIKRHAKAGASDLQESCG